MALPSKIFKGLAFGLTLIVLGLFGGSWARQWYAEYTGIITGISDTGTERSSQRTPTPPPPNYNHYTISPPSQGRVNVIKPITFDDIIAGKASALLPAENNSAIQTGQNVLLYNADDALLEALGHVTEVEQKNEAQLLIHIALKNLPDGKAPFPARGEIITEELPLADRLPVSTLRQTKDKQYYLFEVERLEDGRGKIIARIIDNVKFPNDEFFTFDRPSEYISNIYVTNPDRTLLIDQIVSVTESLFSPTPQINAKNIADIPADEPTVIPAGIQTTTGSCGGTTSACGGNNGSAEFIQRVRDMAKEDKLPPQ